MTPHTTFPAALLGAALLLAHLPLAAAPTMSPPTTLSARTKASVLGQLAGQRQALGLDQDHHYRLTAQHPGANGTQVLRAAHTYKGLRVFGSDSVVVLDKGAKVLSESASERRLHLGKGSANRLGALTASFSVQPQISTRAAIDSALGTLVPGAVHVQPPRAELLIYPVMRMQRVVGAGAKTEAELNALDVQDTVDRYELAYLVSTRMLSKEEPVYFDTVVSARDGAVLDQWNMLQTVLGTGKSQYSGEVPISTTLAKGSYQMLDPERGKGGTFGAMAITNANNGSSAGKVYSNATNVWGDGKQFVEGGSTLGANGQTAAVNAMWGLMNTYDAHKNALGWLSLDGRDTATYIAAHVNRGYDNAYYSDTCRCMFIGDGTYFTSLGSIDVIGHEMGHGITAATSNLIYSGDRAVSTNLPRTSRAKSSKPTRAPAARAIPSRKKATTGSWERKSAAMRRRCAGCTARARTAAARMPGAVRCAGWTCTTAAVRTTACSTSWPRVRAPTARATTTANTWSGSRPP